MAKALAKMTDEELDDHYRGLLAKRADVIQQVRDAANERTERALVREGYYARRERTLADMTVDELEAELERRKLDQTVSAAAGPTLAEVHPAGA